jgi:hypothetical protein
VDSGRAVVTLFDRYASEPEPLDHPCVGLEVRRYGFGRERGRLIGKRERQQDLVGEVPLESRPASQIGLRIQHLASTIALPSAGKRNDRHRRQAARRRRALDRAVEL